MCAMHDEEQDFSRGTPNNQARESDALLAVLSKTLRTEKGFLRILTVVSVISSCELR